MKEKIRVEVAKRISIYDLDGALTDAIGILEGFLRKIPEAYRNVAQLDTDISEYTATFDIYYLRNETEEECANREKRDSHIAEILRQKELMELARLKAKYPDK
jgi:hypothetical protein